MAWGWGSNVGDALAVRNANENSNNLVERINGLHVKLAKAYKNQEAYQIFVNSKANGEAVSEYHEILLAVRPDLIDADADIKIKRVTNLKLFAWVEWWQQILYGQSVQGEFDAPVLRSLSEVMAQGELAQAEAAAASSALKDLAARMEIGMEMEDGHAWVEKRIREMWKTVEFKRDDLAIPVPGSFKQVVPNLIRSEERTGKPFDPFGKDMFGIDDMAAR